MNARQVTNAARAASMVAVLATLGCGGPAASASAEVPQPAANRGFPGFDLLRYPGDSAMRAWQPPFSPYQWVGYYLPAPCHRDASWAGTRARIEEMGYGIGVIYVGQQVWEGAPPPSDSAAAAGPIICSRTLLGTSRGRQDAADAIARTAADGFPRGTVIFLDLERMTTIPDAMRDYYRAWGAAVLTDGRYRPGVYAHGINADEVHRDFAALYASAGVRDADAAVPLWLAQPDPAFTTKMAPTEGGNRRARVWQGRINFDETWRGVTLRIDANVADRRSPSAP